MHCLLSIAGVPGKKPSVTSDKITRFSFQISLYSVVIDEVNLTLHQKSLKALFHTPVQFLYGTMVKCGIVFYKGSFTWCQIQ